MDYVSQLGIVTLASDGRNLAGAWFEGQKYFGGAIGSQWEEKDDLPVFKMAVDWLDRYFQGQRPDIFELPLLIKTLNPSYKLYIRHQLYIPAWETNLYATL